MRVRKSKSKSKVKSGRDSKWDDLPITKFEPIKAGLKSHALEFLAQSGYHNRVFIESAHTKQGAIDAVNRIMRYGRTESGKYLIDTKWFRQQIRLTADLRLANVCTTGASQVSKSLVSYLVVVDLLVNGQVSIGWFYASRQSMFNQQPGQFQAIMKYWLRAVATERVKKHHPITRDSITRFGIGAAVGNFTYVNSASGESVGGATEGVENASFQASIVFLEEFSSYRKSLDASPRLGASQFRSHPVRPLGTPGAGFGIERMIEKCTHNFSPAVRCEHCRNIAWLEPKGCLLKPQKDAKGKLTYEGLRGEIVGFHSTDNTPETAYIICVNCGKKLDTEGLIDLVELYSKQTQQSADEFLDSIDCDVYTDPISIYLSPLLRMDTDPNRVKMLVADGLDPDNSAIYWQNKLGYATEIGSTGVTIAQYDKVLNLPAHTPRAKPFRVAGIDQGRAIHFLTIADVDPLDFSKVNLVYVGTIGQSEIKSTLEYHKVDFALIDNEPDILDTYKIVLSMKGKLSLGNQAQLQDTNLVKGTVRHGSEIADCIHFHNNLYIERVVKAFDYEGIRLNCKLPTVFRKHITSIRRDDSTGKWVRPPDHEDHFFYALVFLYAAIDAYKNKSRLTSASVGAPLKKLTLMVT
jgi:hypothetical protein